MKLFATKKKGKHIKAKGKTDSNGQKKKGLRGLHIGFKIAIGAVLVITALVIAAMAYLKLGVKPPPVKLTPVTPPVIVEDGSEPTVADPNVPVVPIEEVRDKEKYTFLLLGTDDGNGNTDVIMLATLDTSSARGYSLNVVNIPRDTLVNVSWTPKLANTIYSVMKKNGTEEDEMAGVREKFATISGYEVDFFVVVDLKAFVALVDAVGGIYFDVPRSMKYSDPAQNLYIDVAKGPQTLDGKKALQLVRFRSYSSADIGRIEMTQQFLMAAAKQILENKSSIKITSMANIFLNYVKTDLNLDNVIWFAQELFKLDAENISFDTIPANTNDSVNGRSYVTIYVKEWLELINEKLNPFSVPITLDNVSIYTRGADKKLYVTNGVYAGSQSWGGGSGSGGTPSSSGSTSSGSSNNNTSSTPAPTPTPTPAPTATPDGTVDPTATPEITVDPNITDNPISTPETTDVPIATDNPTPPDITPEITETPPPPLATPPDDNESLFYTGLI